MGCGPGEADQVECWYLPVHRYYIQTEILHFIIILHVSSKLPCNGRVRTDPIATLAVEETQK